MFSLQSSVDKLAIWRFSFIASFTLLLTVMVEDAYISVTGIVAKDFGSSVNYFQLTTIVLIFIQGLFMPLFARYGDRLGRLPVLKAGLLTFLAGCMSCFLASSEWLFYGGRIIQGVGASAILVIVPALIRDRYSDNESARQFSVIALVLLVSRVICPELGIKITSALGWRALFAFFALCSLALFVINHLEFRQEKKIIREDSGKFFFYDFIRILCDKPSLRYVIANSCGSMAVFIYLNNASFLFIDYFHTDYSTLAIALTLAFLILGASAVTNIYLLKKFRYEKIMQKAFFILVLMSVLNMVIDWAESHTFTSCMVFLAALFYISGFVGPNSQAGILQEHPRDAATASSVLDVVAIIVSSIVSALVVLSADGTTKALSLYTMSYCLISLFIWHWLRVKEPASETEQDHH
ncbi:MFS transporter [Endozoicomonas arenosclerae]|uniref:MFS transporter n=1 Tax=Endozoicomonas arenosclerae TaxID=1633495 RepID=UPI0007855CC0|nr:MFS transporter [Endozoicomonas arenosclerae]